MIVTLGLSHSQSKKNFTGHVGHFVQNQFPLHSCVALIPFVDAVSKKPGCDHVVKVFWIDLIALQVVPGRIGRRVCPD